MTNSVLRGISMKSITVREMNFKSKKDYIIKSQRWKKKPAIHKKNITKAAHENKQKIKIV